MSRRDLVRVESSSTISERSIEVSSSIAKELDLVQNQTIKVCLGSKEIMGEVLLRPGSIDRTLRFSNRQLQSLYCPKGIQLHIQRSTDGSIRLGPVLGIFAPKYRIGRFGAHTPYIRQLVRYGRRVGMLAFVFASGDIDFQNKTTTGYLYGSTGHWKKAKFPLPDVVYDRIPSRRIEAQSRIKKAKKQLRETEGILCFNDSFMDKWKVHRLLVNDVLAAKYLPKTKRYEGLADLQAFLSKYRKVYLKPTGGSQGHGIIKVTRFGGERFEYVVSGRGGGSIIGYKALAARMKRIIGSRRYIIQQGLNLATFGGRHFDIRILMQKDSTGKWLRTKVYARVAAIGRITSNISTGAEGIPMARVLRRAFGSRAGSISARVKAAGQKLPPIIEKEIGQNLGELGLDIGVDTRGRVWLIEVNSKPFRHMTTETGSKLPIIRSVLRPLSYTLGLTGFHKMRFNPIEGGEDQYEVGN